MTKKPISVALAIPANDEYSRNVIQGVVRFTSIAKPWLLSQWGTDCKPTTSLDSIEPIGIIASVQTQQQADLLAAFNVPVVNISAAVLEAPFPRVSPDDVGIGELAAQHFLQRGLRHFAYVGYSERNDSKLRCSGFVDRLLKEGIRQVTAHQIAPADATEQHLKKWLTTLKKPAGIFVMDDAMGRRVVDACRANSAVVSRDYAILGCGNDPVICGMALPHLTSVSLPGERVGYEAATLLEHLLNGEFAPPSPNLLPVSSVVTRSSTDIVSIEDHDVAAAMRFILAHAGEWIGVPELLLAVPVQRRTLERKFRQVLGRSPLEEIRRVRMETAQELLANTDLPMPIVARRAGFSQAKQLSLVFRAMMGTTPTEYRARFRIETAQLPPE
jgi:LacI family transcriptional regulator